jgi:hypothetical protein
VNNAYLRLAPLFFYLLSAPLRALDFAPQESWRMLEGVRLPVVMFTDPIGKIRYQPPGGWNYNGGGPIFTLYPPKSNGAFMKIQVLGHAKGTPEITDLASDELAKWCQHYLADDAQETKLTAENPSPFMLDGKPSREFVFEYKSSGQRYQTSVAVMDWNDHEHLAVIITSLDADFKGIHNIGIGSLFSWSVRKTETAAAQATPTPSPAATDTVAAGPSAPGPTPIKAISR